MPTGRKQQQARSRRRRMKKDRRASAKSAARRAVVFGWSPPPLRMEYYSSRDLAELGLRGERPFPPKNRNRPAKTPRSRPAAVEQDQPPVRRKLTWADLY